MLASLEHAQLIQRRPDERYMLSPTASRLNSVYMDSFKQSDVVMSILQDLVEKPAKAQRSTYVREPGQTGSASASFAFTHPRPCDPEEVGTFLPINRGAGARVLLAFGENNEPQIAPDERALYEQIRADGYFAAIGDRLPELDGISAPVFYRNGVLAGAISLTIPDHRYSSRLVPDVVDAGKRLSRVLP